MIRVKTHDIAASSRKHPWIIVSAAMAVNLCLAFALAFAAGNSFDHFWPALGTLAAVSFSVFIIALLLIRDLTESSLERALFVIAGSFALTICGACFWLSYRCSFSCFILTPRCDHPTLRA